MLETATFGTIIAICYFIGIIAKNITVVKDNYIPVIVGVAGGVLGIVGFYTIPEYPATDVLTAISVGIASGLASVGINQVVRQTTKDVG